VKVAMLVLASGRSLRFGGEVPKVWQRCAGKAVLQWSVERLARVTDHREIVVAVHPQDRERYLPAIEAELEAAGATRFVDGGETRQESMARAFAASGADCATVLVHDAARPLFPIDATRELLRRIDGGGAALLALPCAETLKQVDADGRVVATIDRDGVWLAQTPQAMRRELLAQALQAARQAGFNGTDDVSLLERIGVRAEVVRGSRTNVKITDRDDLELVQALLEREARR
jgi:2-C-methyl-D-erythritol 4-phosphate cytidylyltransferase